MNDVPKFSPERAHQRCEFQVPVTFASPEVSGTTINISYGGLAFALPEPDLLPLGGLVTLTLSLADAETLTLTANVCWRVGNTAGVAFDGLDRAQRQAVSKIVSALEASQP